MTSSVHLPSHAPILEGSGRGLEPRRLRGNDESPVRSRLPARVGSHHARVNAAQGPPPPPPAALLLLTAADPCWPPAFSKNELGPLRTGLLRTPNHLLGHTFRRTGDTKTQRHGEAVTTSPGATDTHEHHMIPSPAAVPRLTAGYKPAAAADTKQLARQTSRMRASPSTVESSRAAQRRRTKAVNRQIRSPAPASPSVSVWPPPPLRLPESFVNSRRSREGGGSSQ